MDRLGLARLLKDATDRLIKANGDATQIGVATSLLQGSQEKVSEVTEQLQKLDEERTRIRKRKTERLNNCEVQLKKKKE